MSEFASFNFATLSKSDSYKLLVSTVMPRPIAWITTRAENGSVNAAPFSFFNAISSDPPLLVVGFSAAPDRDEKDTLAHIRTTGEFVVHLISHDLVEAMNITAANAPRGTEELDLAGLHTLPSTAISTPRIAEAPVAFECKLQQMIEPGATSTIVLGRILQMHLREDVFANREKLYVDPHKLDLIGRMAGTGGYCTTRDQFEIERLSWPLKK